VPNERGGAPRTLLEKLVKEREATYEEQAEAFEKLSRELGEDATMSVRHLQRLAAGQRGAANATPTTRRVMRQLYGHSLDELLGPPGETAAPPLTAVVERLDLDTLRTHDESTDALAQLTSDLLTDPLAPANLGVTPEAWQAVVVRWMLEPESRARGGASGTDVSAADVEVIRSATRMLSGWDYQFGGGRSRLLVGQCLATEALPLARRVSPSTTVGRDYLTAVAALARLAGWTAYDIGSHGSAQRLLTVALNLTQEAGDRALGGRILAGMSHQANYLGQPRRAVELARAAREGARGQATPTAVALFYAMEARALASSGDEAACTAALSAAETALLSGDPANDPEWVRFFDAAELHAEFAHCFRDLGKPQLAADHAQLSIEKSDSMYVRSLSFCRTVLATAYAQRGELDEALHIARGVVDTAAQLRSQRVMAYLDDFRGRLDVFGSASVKTDFDLYVADRLPRLELAPAAGQIIVA
jgi:hypothetical protein